MLLHAAEHGSALFRRVFGLAIAVVAKVRRNNIGRSPFFRFRNAERAIMLLQAGENIVCEPRVVPKLERCLNASRDGCEELSQQLRICLHVRWQLEEHWPQLPCSSQRLNGADKS